MTQQNTKQQGERHRELVARRSREKSASVREIAPLPPIRNPQRRIKARTDLQFFLKEYFPNKFNLDWSSYHAEVIKKLQKIFIEVDGNKLAIAMPRGSGKTSIVAASAIWALLFGHCRYLIIFGASKSAANGIIKIIKSDLENNAALLEDFPEGVYPFVKLGGQALRARGQLYLGEKTEVEWKPDSITFGKIAGSLSSGAMVVTAGIEGAFRGKLKAMPDGSLARPDGIIFDDVQTDASARNPDRVTKLESIINGSAAGLVGPGEELTMVMACTVIQQNDLSDRFLDRENYSQWHGLRYKMIEQMPANLDLWLEYKEIRKNDAVAATMFYKHNRKKMQEGAVVAWKDNFSPSCIDALQFAMNKWADNYESFMSEYQNDPLRLTGDALVTEAKVIRSRLNGLEEHTLPREAATLTAFIDVHYDVLYYAVAGFADDFTGYIIDYGTYPKQRRRYFRKSDSGLITLCRDEDMIMTGGRKQVPTGIIIDGVAALIKDLLAACWYVDGDADGTEHPVISKILIDSGGAPEIAEGAIRIACGRTNVVMPSKGVSIRAVGQPMAQWKRKPGRKFGNRWIEDKPQNRTRMYFVDVNYWKEQVHKVFSETPGNRGGMTLWGRDPEQHRLFSEHLNSEIPKASRSDEREVNEWQLIPNRDNHFFDCAVGVMAAASICGVREHWQEKPVEKEIINLAKAWGKR
ncbi:MAG: phage terminase large subunit family protein [Planctomycetaceae bacterium]|nr:phage terminase large subunit family protein [Planctomycetaceae bacterium]